MYGNERFALRAAFKDLELGRQAFKAVAERDARGKGRAVFRRQRTVGTGKVDLVDVPFRCEQVVGCLLYTSGKQRNARTFRAQPSLRHRAANDLCRLHLPQRPVRGWQDAKARKCTLTGVVLWKHGIAHTVPFQIFCRATRRKARRHSLSARNIHRAEAHAAQRARAVFLPRVPIADQTQQPSSLPQKSSPPIYGGERLRYALTNP